LSRLDLNIPRENYPEEYLAILDNSAPDYNNCTLFQRTGLYANLMQRYAYIYAIPEMTNENIEETNAKNGYTFFNRIHDQIIKEYLLTEHLGIVYKKRLKCYDSLLSEFNKTYPSAISYHYLDSLNKVQKANASLSIENALLATILTNKKAKLSLKSLLGKKPVLIDCWASWCAPCLKEMPFSKKLEEKYVKKIRFIYLSFDKNANAWIRKYTQLGMAGDSFLLENDFGSTFSAYFNITGIPRYLLFDKDGKLVSDTAPRPSKNDKLEDLIKSVL